MTAHEALMQLAVHDNDLAAIPPGTWQAVAPLFDGHQSIESRLAELTTAKLSPLRIDGCAIDQAAELEDK